MVVICGDDIATNRTGLLNVVWEDARCLNGSANVTGWLCCMGVK